MVTTDNFAGVERYICDVAGETAARGWKTTVVGGNAKRMPAALHPNIRWLPGATPAQALVSIARVGRQDVCHAHMTVAEAIAVATRPRHRAPVVSTRHFAAARGSSGAGRLVAPWIAARLERQIAVSDFVARRLEQPPDAVIKNGVPPSPCLWQAANRVVLVLQRLEREKDTFTALRAWQDSRLVDEGWSLRVVGDGSERAALEAWTVAERATGVVFTGWVPDVAAEFSIAGILLAPGSVDSFGLGVVEAMAAGVPVLACASGGHLETVGLLSNPTMFPRGDAAAAAAGLRSLRCEEARAALSNAEREIVEESFTIARHVDQLLAEYETAIGSSGTSTGQRGWSLRSAPGARARDRDHPVKPSSAHESDLRELVVCSLEAWDDVWRRNQFFTDILLRRHPGLRVLFVEPAADPLFDLFSRRMPTLPRLRSISADGRLRAFRPLKPLPRKFGPLADDVVRSQVVYVARFLGFLRPTLWLNDVTYAPLIAPIGWPTVYDVTDDWLLAPAPPRELERLRRLDELALNTANEVVVCSQALAVSRGQRRRVSLIPNGVDIEHFRRPRPRPDDLPDGPVAVYVGTLHDARTDVKLVKEVADALPHASIVLVGPNSLGQESQRQLAGLANVILLGPRPYSDVPAYLQHADVVIVPHLISPFTESLDPIKTYECLVVDTPTVATPVAGFRDHPDALNVVDRDAFPARVAEVISGNAAPAPRTNPIGWNERALAFEEVLLRATVSLHDAQI